MVIHIYTFSKHSSRPTLPKTAHDQHGANHGPTETRKPSGWINESPFKKNKTIQKRKYAATLATWEECCTNFFVFFRCRALKDHWGIKKLVTRTSNKMWLLCWPNCEWDHLHSVLKPLARHTGCFYMFVEVTATPLSAARVLWCQRTFSLQRQALKHTVEK